MKLSEVGECSLIHGFSPFFRLAVAELLPRFAGSKAEWLGDCALSSFDLRRILRFYGSFSSNEVLFCLQPFIPSTFPLNFRSAWALLFLQRLLMIIRLLFTAKSKEKSTPRKISPSFLLSRNGAYIPQFLKVIYFTCV